MIRYRLNESSDSSHFEFSVTQKIDVKLDVTVTPKKNPAIVTVTVIPHVRIDNHSVFITNDPITCEIDKSDLNYRLRKLENDFLPEVSSYLIASDIETLKKQIARSLGCW